MKAQLESKDTEITSLKTTIENKQKEITLIRNAATAKDQANAAIKVLMFYIYLKRYYNL